MLVPETLLKSTISPTGPRKFLLMFMYLERKSQEKAREEQSAEIEKRKKACFPFESSSCSKRHGRW